MRFPKALGFLQFANKTILDRFHCVVARQVFTDDNLVKSEIAHFVGGVSMMVNNICNANCIFCAYQYNEEPKQTMSFELFKGAMHDLSDVGYVGTLLLTPTAGEPLADRNLFEKISYAKDRCGVKTIMFATNGILLEKNDNYKKIVDLGLSQVVISCTRFDDEAYQRVYRSREYNRVRSGVFKLLEYKKQNLPNAGDLHIRISMSLESVTDEIWQSEDMQRLKGYIDEGVCEFYPVNEFDNWSGHIRQDDLVGSMKLKEPEREKFVPCWRMINDLAVMPDGNVRVCSCRYYKTNKDDLCIGDVSKNKFNEIIFGDRHKKLLRNVAMGKWPKVCEDCSLYEPLQWTARRYWNLARKSLLRRLTFQRTDVR